MERDDTRPTITPTTQARLERETNAMVKRVLSEMEELAALEPHAALDPVGYNDRRKRVTRALWNLVRQAVQAGAEIITEYECPHCGEMRRHVTRSV